MNKLYFKAEIQNMGKEEILKMIAPDTLERIKKTDKSPLIKVFAVGHEGEAHGKMIGKGLAVLRYLKNVIVELAQKIKIGLQIFYDHAETNLHAGREIIGEVIGKSLQMIDDKLYSLAAVYIYPQYRTMPLDIASIEANITFDTNSEVLSIDEVSGIALGNSKIAQPGFPGAKLLGALQAFVKKGEGDKMTLKEIQEAIKEGNYKIEDVFTDEEIGSHPKVKELEKKHKDEQEHAKRVEKKYGEEREAHLATQKENDTLKESNKKLNEIKNKTSVNSLFEKEVKDRKLNEKETAFIKKNLDKFTSGKEGDELDREFSDFMDKQVDEFGEVKKIVMGEKDNDKDKDTKKKGEGADDKDKDKDDLTNPENNDFIP